MVGVRAGGGEAWLIPADDRDMARCPRLDPYPCEAEDTPRTASDSTQYHCGRPVCPGRPNVLRNLPTLV